MNTKTVKQGKQRGVASVLPVKVIPCVKRRGSYERFFEYKFEPLETGLANVPTEDAQENLPGTTKLLPGVLGALVMPNAICVLVASETSASTLQLASVSFEEKDDGTMELSTDAISGKKKKGARRVKAGHRMCVFTYTDGTSRIMLSPISGCVLEVNHTQLISDPSLVLSEPFGRGFIAIVQPEHDLMSTLEGSNGIIGAADQAFEKSNPRFSLEMNPGVPTGVGLYGEPTYGTGNSDAAMAAEVANVAEGTGTGTGTGKRAIASRIIGKPCFAFKNTSGCLRGDACRFDHVVTRDDGIEEVLNPRLKKRRKACDVCYDFIAGKCHRGDECSFLHGVVEEQPADK